jgi:allophanate hydrolase
VHENERDLVPLNLVSLRAAYLSKALSPGVLVETLCDRIDAKAEPGIWIRRTERAAMIDVAQRLDRGRIASLPLYGVPFAVKDNIDVEGMPTTAGCPAFTYVAERTAPVVARLVEAGALLVGKTNLDQFATGLVGTRSPFGIPTNPFDARYVTGGSSSGSAAAVARGLVSFALGTDTAGSGRVPAAFNNIVGLKPSRGLFSTSGIVPACRSLDCASIFALTCDDARQVAEVATAYDPSDPYSRQEADVHSWTTRVPARFRFAVPRDADLAEIDQDVRRGMDESRALLESLGGEPQPTELAPFFEAARLLYEGPWLAERLVYLADFLRTKGDSCLPVTRQILSGGARFDAVETFAAMHRLESLKRQIAPVLADIVALLLPTAPTLPTIDEVAKDPIFLNAKLGTFTNFVNLLDLAAVAIPAGFRRDGLPVGVSLIGPRGSDAMLLALASLLHARSMKKLGATPWFLPSFTPDVPTIAASDATGTLVAVVGAHLAGQPLNHELTDRGATFVRAARTAPRYRLFALPTVPPKPGLVRVPEASSGFSIDVEVWRVPRERLGDFLAGIGSPLCLGTVELEGGALVTGFLCEGFAAKGARDISTTGGWRAYLDITPQSRARP